MSGPLLRCTLWCRRLMRSSSGDRRGGLSKKYDDQDDAEAGEGAAGGGGNSHAHHGGGGSPSSFWHDAQRMLKLFVFSLLLLLVVTPDVPRWAGAKVAPALAGLACGMGGSENVALCGENVNAALRDALPVTSSSKASASGVDCAETCKDEIAAAAKVVDMDDPSSGARASAIIRGAGVSDCKPARLNCTELEDELWSRINSLESALVASNRQIAKKEEDMEQQAELIREQQAEIGNLHASMDKKEKEMKRFLKNSTAACLEGRKETVDLREALEQANSVLQRVEREVAAGAAAAAGEGGQQDATAAAAATAATAGGKREREMTPEQRARERERGERERARMEREREARDKEKHAHAGIYRRSPPVNHGDLLELERKLDEVNKKLKVARGGRP